MIPEEIKLGDVAVQVFLADVVIDFRDPPFYQGKRAFRRVGVNVTTNVFLPAFRLAGLGDYKMVAELVRTLAGSA